MSTKEKNQDIRLFHQKDEQTYTFQEQIFQDQYTKMYGGIRNFSNIKEERKRPNKSKS